VLLFWLLSPLAALGETMPWTGSGDTVNFLAIIESSATDPLPLFGEPTVSGNQLLFSPSSFASYSQNLFSDQTDGHLMMTIALKPGQASGITGIHLNEMGDYSLLGAPGALAGASISTPVTLMINNDMNLTMTGNMTFSSKPIGATDFVAHGQDFSLPQDDGAGILWQGDLNADINAFLKSKNYAGQATSIYLSLDDVLATWSQAGASSKVEKKFFGLEVTTAAVPEPSTAMLLVAGALGTAALGCWRRRYEVGVG
jgi:hypothetical protein